MGIHDDDLHGAPDIHYNLAAAWDLHHPAGFDNDDIDGAIHNEHVDNDVHDDDDDLVKHDRPDFEHDHPADDYRGGDDDHEPGVDVDNVYGPGHVQHHQHHEPGEHIDVAEFDNDHLDRLADDLRTGIIADHRCADDDAGYAHSEWTDDDDRPLFDVLFGTEPADGDAPGDLLI
jgi:hypothetical protein